MGRQARSALPVQRVEAAVMRSTIIGGTSMKRALVMSAGAAAAVTLAGASWVQVSAQSKPQVPQFQYDKTWPKPLPNQMKVGQVVGVAVDSRDHIWIVQRPGTLKPSETEAQDGAYGGFRGAVAGCCRRAAPVIEFDQAGNMVQMWGGPEEGLEWPTPGPKSPDNAYGHAPFGERGIFVDFNDNVWL